MPPSRYPQKIRILRDVDLGTTDSLNNPNEQAAEVGTFWAKVMPVRGGEPSFNSQVQANVTHKITVPWDGRLDTVHTGMRIVRVHGSSGVLEIVSKLHEPQDPEVEIQCIERI